MFVYCCHSPFINIQPWPIHYSLLSPPPTSHTLTHTHSLSLTHTLSLSHTHTLSLSLTHTLSLTVCTLSHSHTHTHTHSHTHTHTHTQHTHTHTHTQTSSLLAGDFDSSPPVSCLSSCSSCLHSPLSLSLSDPLDNLTWSSIATLCELGELMFSLCYRRTWKCVNESNIH